MVSALRSLWIWLAATVLILVWLPLLACIRLFDRDPVLYRTGRWFRRLGALLTRINPTWKVHQQGVQISDPRRPYVVVCNHQSLADIPVISRLPWEMKWVAKAELFRIPFVGWMMHLAGDIPLERGSRRSGAQTLKAARQYLQGRCSVMFFPEGTRSHDGQVLPFSDGAFCIAIKEQVPILPLVVDGTRGALPKNSWHFGTAGDTRLAVLEPIQTEGLSALDTAGLRDEVRQRILDQLAVWRGEEAQAEGN